MGPLQDYARNLDFAPIELLKRIESRGQIVLSVMSELKSMDMRSCASKLRLAGPRMFASKNSSSRRSPEPRK
jgi:hypothetical protein